MAVHGNAADAESFGFSPVAGKNLRGANREDLGHVADVLIDPQSGQVRFAIVPSGQGPTGLTYRLVPLSAVQGGGAADEMLLRLNQGQWNQVGTSTEQELQGRIVLNTDLQRRLSDQFRLSGDDARNSTELLRASQLKNIAVRSGSDQIGTVENVFIDRRNMAVAVIKPSGGYANGAQLYMVPMDRLDFSANGQTTITTNLTRADFQSAQSNLAPTGNGQYGQQAFGQQDAASSAASAVQQALSRDQSAAGVQVVPESRLVLRGTVQNEQQKAQIQQAAAQAAPGVRIDNEITVRRW